jgi:phosphocarrier protein HPr
MTTPPIFPEAQNNLVDHGELCELVTIVNEKGLHARAAAKFVKIAEHSLAHIEVTKDLMKVSGRSIMGLMMLAAPKGAVLKLTASGAGAADLLSDLTDLIKRKFDESE